MNKDSVPVKAGSKPTLKTVAQATGYAVTTVSRALADDPKIAKTTRETVAKAAKSLGYIPDRAAQRLRTGRTQVITLLLNPAHEYLGFTDELLTGLATAFRGTGYSVTITPDFIDSDRVGTIRNILRNGLADGIVLTRTECFDPRVRLLLERNFPFVSHGRTEFSTQHAYVDYDNEAFARQAVRRLLEAGRRRPMIVLPEARFTFAQHLRFGFLSEVRDEGVEHFIPEDLTLDAPPEVISQRLTEILQGTGAPDGIVCVGEVMAMAALAAIHDAGLTTGKDVDVLLKQASPVFNLMRPRMRPIHEDIEATGRTLGEMMLKRIDGAAPETLQRILAPGSRPVA